VFDSEDLSVFTKETSVSMHKRSNKMKKEYTITVSKNTINGILVILEYAAIFTLYVIALSNTEHLGEMLFVMCLSIFIYTARMKFIVDSVRKMFKKVENSNEKEN